MKNRFNLNFCFVILALGMAGCASKTINTGGGYQKAQWETKALVKDLKKDKTQSLNIDILAIKNDRTRFEITALMGFRVASLAMSQKDISYVVYPQKSFFYGRNSETAFSRLIDLPLHPMNLTNIAFDEPIRGQGWKCQLDMVGMISNCENIGRKITVQWADRKEGTKKILIKSPQFEMQWLFSAPQTEVQFKSDTFTLSQPQGFKAIQIN